MKFCLFLVLLVVVNMLHMDCFYCYCY